MCFFGYLLYPLSRPSYYGQTVFLQFKEFEWYWCAVFFKISPRFLRPFHLSEKSNKDGYFGHTEIVNGAKNPASLRRDIF